jgi:hypothetical protein
LDIGDDQVLMGAHERDRVYADPELLGAHSERVEVEVTNGWVGAEEMVATKGASGDHHGVAWEH